MKIEHYEGHTVIEVHSREELIEVHSRELPYPISIRLIEKADSNIHRTIFSYDAFGELENKTLYIEDSLGNELENIEFDKSGNILQRIEFENYPNGNTKWMYVYDKDGNLIKKESFDEE